MRLFDDFVKEMNKSILRVGHRLSLANEAAVHHYILPVPTQTMISGFIGVYFDE